MLFRLIGGRCSCSLFEARFTSPLCFRKWAAPPESELHMFNAALGCPPGPVKRKEKCAFCRALWRILQLPPFDGCLERHFGRSAGTQGQITRPHSIKRNRCMKSRSPKGWGTVQVCSRFDCFFSVSPFVSKPRVTMCPWSTRV